MRELTRSEPAWEALVMVTDTGGVCGYGGQRDAADLQAASEMKPFP